MLDAFEIVDVYGCSQCSHHSASVFQLDHHIRRKHKNVYATEHFRIELFHAIVEPEQFSCIYCDYQSHYQFEVCEHYKQAHNPRTGNNVNNSKFGRYACEYCRCEYSILCLLKHYEMCEGVPQNSTEQNRGISASTSTQIVWFECEHCSYRAKRKGNLQRHMLKHVADEEINWFRCNHCSYRAKQKSNLKLHMLQHAANDEVNWFECQHCSYRARRKANLQRHMLQHVNDEIAWHKCDQCSYRAKTKAALKSQRLRNLLTVKHFADQN